MSKNPILKKNPVFPFIKDISIQKRRDLQYFIQMPSTSITKKEIKIAQYILNNSSKKRICTNEEIIDEFFSQHKKPKVAWQKTKHRIQQTFLRYYTMRKLDKHPLRGMLLAEIYEEYEQKIKKKSTLKRHKKKLNNLLNPDKELYEYWLLEMSINEQRKQREWSSDLEEMERRLDEFYLEKKFRCLFEKANRKDLVKNSDSGSNEKEHFNFLEWAICKVKNSGSIKAKIYYMLYSLLELENNTYVVNDIETLIEENHGAIDNDTLEEFYTCLFAYYIINVNQGKNQYTENYLNSLSKVLELGIIYNNSELSLADFKNSIGIALVRNDIATAWELLEHHKNKPSFLRGEGKYVFNFMQATIFLNEDKYTKAQKVLMPYQLRDYFHDIDSLLLNLQLDYSLNMDHSSILKNMKTVKIRITNHEKIPTPKKKIYLNFLAALKQLIEEKILSRSKFKGKISILKWRWLEKMEQRLGKRN